jgi:molybdate transport repressor ModE-like protein
LSKAPLNLSITNFDQYHSQNQKELLDEHSKGAGMTFSRKALDYRVEPFDLRLFAAVLEHGTITRAARAMSLSLTAASTRLKQLEHIVGVQLLERSKSGALPTSAGRALARHAGRVLLELDALHTEMADFGRGLRGTVRLLCNTAAMTETLPPLLGRFLVEHPDLDIDLQELSSDDVLDAMRREVADIGIVADYVDTSGLVVRPLADDQLMAVVPSARPRKRPPAIRFVALLDQPFVGLPADSGLSRYLHRQAARSGRVPHHRLRVRDFDAVLRLVGMGVGVAVMPRSAATRRRFKAVEIVPLTDPWSNRKLLLCTTERTAGSVGAQALVNFLTQTA